MNKLHNTSFLFLLIILEGYIILSSELLAMRQTVPFVGSGTDTISIIIAAVLMPLAFGYQAGGNFSIKGKDGKYRSIRKKLLKNIAVSSAFLVCGLSYFAFQFFFLLLDEIGLRNNLVQTALYCTCFIVIPMYLLGQTVPLLSNYFSKEKLSHVTGKMLFFSTMGSFFGSILTTLVLMDAIGVFNTITLNFIILLAVTAYIGNKRTRDFTVTMIVITICSGFLNSPQIKDILRIVEDNKYSTIMIVEDEEKRTHLVINHNDSSMYSDDKEKHDYVEFSERITIDAIPESAPAKNILVIGAGGFTFGHGDLKNNYIYVDIDKDLKPISEKYLLKEKLQTNKIFYPLPARAYLAQTDQKFDIILLDAYLGALSIPEHLVTREFFMEVKNHMTDGSVLLANFIASHNFNDPYSKNIDNTLHDVFPYLSRHNADKDGKFHFFTDKETKNSNYIYIYKHFENIEPPVIYRETEEQ